MKLRDIEKIKVGGLVYRVRWMDGMGDVAKILGNVNHVARQIVIDGSADPASTMIHELIHAIEHATAADISEEWTCRLEHVIRALIIDNPDMIRAICDSVGAEAQGAAEEVTP